MAKPLRRIKKAKIAFISLVPKGANKLPVIYKEDDNSLVLNPIVKAGDDFTEKGELLVIAYAPEKMDSQGDIASSDVIKAMAYDYMKSGGQIDIRHDGKALGKDKVYIAENFIVQKGDPRFENFTDYDDNHVDATGSWGMVLKVEDPDLRKLYNSGDWAGVSIAGSAEFEKASLSKAEQIIEDLVASMNNKESTTKTTEEADVFMTVTKEELVGIFKEQNESLIKGIAEAIQRAQPVSAEQKQEKLEAFCKEQDIELPKPAKKTPKGSKETEDEDLTKAPVFKGDPTDSDALKEHTFALKEYELRKDVDWTDAESVTEYGEALADLQKENGGEVKKKRPGKSKAPKGTIDKEEITSDFFNDEFLTKEEQEGAEAGEVIAEVIRKEQELAAGGRK